MASRKITLTDACVLTGYKRAEIGHILKNMPPYSLQKLEERKARILMPIDLVVLCVIRKLADEFGINVYAIFSIGEVLRSVLMMPRLVSSKSGLLITLKPPKVKYVELPVLVESGSVLRLQSVFRQVDEYLHPGFSSMHMNHEYSTVKNQSKKVSG